MTEENDESGYKTTFVIGAVDFYGAFPCSLDHFCDCTSNVTVCAGIFFGKKIPWRPKQ